ncbi:hypothetical protein KL930_000375 [Ogataea haglerorum]|uniref:SWR1-complex protein 4 n=1 Tax=Ogataea haglerorum TaxID=1937702 RepID=A0AAN6D4Q0_9ASCO|nr:uncharacterized protein KL911_000756 [Ogataea haglerorum]KAG7697570.1 hypothetical protein KL951_002144 [Ogataea haglerorum]KAG7701171.1 hypothetical protein KL915_000202 [Ogataea haglerorum]KAG7705922.1 hypothetical protein KL950_003498 [Ogataea haglerorum]KAG7709129.1 hypothetical protein KL914_001519 [Ogataea haglerorum]KAG7715257.1 hypothetical protein KL913_004089 [Ogataea haglerorum]
MASDILDVFNIKEEARVQPKKHARADNDFGTQSKKKKHAMSRELYNLIGTNLPPVAVEKGFKFKDKINSGKASPWVWAPFKNEARSDELELHHWVKGLVAPSDEKRSYNFAKYNTSLDIPSFSKEEYDEKLKDLSEDWDYDETKYLFDLAKDYDLRWAVVYDRYEYRNDKHRGLEDLKERLYSVSAKLLSSNPDGTRDVALIKGLESFDKKQELERKQYLNRLIHRAPTEIAEEESLVIEARKFELAAKKMLMERAQLLQLLDSPQSSASIEQYTTSSGLTQLYNSLMTVDKSKKRKPEVPVPPQLGPNAIPHTQQIQQAQQQHLMRQRQGKKSTLSQRLYGGKQEISQQQAQSEVWQLLQSKLTAEEMEVYGLRFHDEKLQPGVYIRSQKLSSFKPAVQAKVAEVLNELQMSMKPTLPTANVCSKFDQLLQSIATLIDLKKQTDKLSGEVALIKSQKGVE